MAFDKDGPPEVSNALGGPIMTVAEVAAYLRTHVTTIYRLLKTGQLPAFRIGTEWRFHRQTIEQWMRDRTQPVNAKD